MKKSKTDAHQCLKDANRKTLRLNFVAGDVPALNPQSLSSAGRGIALGKWLFEGLTRLNLEGKYELAGAEKVDISSCQTRYTFTLRPNTYSNGDAVIAADYERCWKEALAPNSNCLKAHLFYSIKNAENAKKGKVSLNEIGVKALDDYTLFVELNHPASNFLGLLSLCLFAPFKKDRDEVVFNGPYKVVQRRKDSYLELESNSFFWDHARTSINRVKISMIRDGMTALSLYEQGEIDWIGDPFSWLSSDIISSEVDKGNFFKGADVIYPFWIYLNTKHPALSSRLIRRALSCVINRDEIAKHIFTGDSPLFTPTPHNSRVVNLSDDSVPDGQKLFKQGMEALSLTKDTFPPLKLSFCKQASHTNFAEYLQEVWQTAFGIQVNLEGKEWNTFYADLISGNYQMGGYYLSSDYNDPLACLDLLASENNFSRWQHSHYQKTIEQLKRESDPQRKLQLLNEAESILQEEFPIIWVLNRVQYHSYPSRLKGLCFDQRGLPDLRWAYFE
ncbi:MAG: peptide ABC transporter substrate-binding protein [Chlamydiota bacterium]